MLAGRINRPLRPQKLALGCQRCEYTSLAGVDSTLLDGVAHQRRVAVNHVSELAVGQGNE